MVRASDRPETSRERRLAPARRRRGWGGFVARYGWRAYALPVLSIITVAALAHAATSNANPTSDGQTASGANSGGGNAATHNGGSTQVDGLDSATAKYQQGAAPPAETIRLAGDVMSC
ncbi:MAG TPA: hypothetical protein VKB75_02675, partial [Jatrophihabitans sp.]|nr:hypothetical protein [Jatrophihabitans sp.]